MPYITKFKLRNTLFRIEGKILDDPIKRLLKDRLYFLSKNNREYIGIFLLFVKDPIKFIKTHYIEWKDTFTFIVEKNPAFHTEPTCDMLNSAFDNVLIPGKIKIAGLSKALRAFANTNEDLFKRDRAGFIKLCIIHFNASYIGLLLTETDFIPIARPNSGISDYHDATVSEILEAIRTLLGEINNFLAIEENAIIARNLIDKIYLKDKPDLPRPLGIPLETVRNSLTQLDFFNKEFLNAASEYYLALFNPKNEYDPTILKILNFKSCRACYANVDISALFDLTVLKNYEDRSLIAMEENDMEEIGALLTF